MIEVKVDSIRVSLMNQQRVVLLKDLFAERYLPIWIGQFEADAIMLELRERRLIKRPLTHDLLKNVIETMGGELKHILINDIRGDVYFARLVVEMEGRSLEIDARPSDAIALAVRAKCGIFVAEAVMSKNAVEPEEEIDLGEETRSFFSRGELDKPASERQSGESPFEDFVPDEPDLVETVDESQISAFADFLNSLDLDELDDEDN